MSVAAVVAATSAVLVSLVVGGPVAALAPSTASVVTVQDERITESSGLVVSPTHRDLVWTVNDSGSTAVVYGVSTTTGRTRVVLRLTGTDARDTEAMTATVGPDGRGLLWVADTGDNRLVRESVVLRLLREPRTVGSAQVRPVSLRVRYADGPVDVETIIWTPDGRLLLVTKELLSGRVLEVPHTAVAAAVAGRSTSEPVVAQPVGTVLQSLVTDGAALPDGRLVLRGYGGATVYAGPGPAASGAADRVLEALESVDLPEQQQGETLAVERNGRTALVGSEGVRQKLWRVTLPAGAPPTPSAATSSAPAQPGGATLSGSSGRTGRSAASASSSGNARLWAGSAGAVLLVVGALAVIGRRTRRARVAGARPRGRRRP